MFCLSRVVVVVRGTYNLFVRDNSMSIVHAPPVEYLAVDHLTVACGLLGVCIDCVMALSSQTTSKKSA